MLAGDKSLSHRAALFASLADGESTIHNFLVSGVTDAMLRCLTQLGISYALNDSTLRILGGSLSYIQPTAPLNCGNSATTLRMLAGAVTAAKTPCMLDGSEGLRKRPMNRIVDPLRLMGAAIESPNGCAPLFFQGAFTPLRAIDYTLPVASAQVKSCLILAALAAEGESVISEPGPSRDHTERMLSAMGAAITCEGRSVRVTPLIQPLRPLEMTLPGDISSAAFLIVAALITPESRITLRNIGLNPTRTGIIDALQAMGGRITLSNLHEEAGEPAGDITIESSELQATEISGDLVIRMIDEIPAFAIAAAYAQGTTVIRDAHELRLKESDRIEMICGGLQALNVQYESFPDGFTVTGGPVSGGSVPSQGDHRIAMAFAVAGLAAQSTVTITDAQIADESFPGYAATLAKLGAQIIQS